MKFVLRYSYTSSYKWIYLHANPLYSYFLLYVLPVPVHLSFQRLILSSIYYVAGARDKLRVSDTAVRSQTGNATAPCWSAVLLLSLKSQAQSRTV